jgi:hypothetical protein
MLLKSSFMRPKYPGSEFSVNRGKESLFTFENKIEHIKAARQKKIEKMEAEGVKLTQDEKNKVTLTAKEYDNFRDPKNSLSSTTIAQEHTWNLALQEAGILAALKHPDYTRSSLKKIIVDFFENFKTRNGRYPSTEEYDQLRKKNNLPGHEAVKRITGQTIKDYLVSLGIYSVRQSGVANQPYKGEEGKKFSPDVQQKPKKN